VDESFHTILLRVQDVYFVKVFFRSEYMAVVSWIVNIVYAEVRLWLGTTLQLMQVLAHKLELDQGLITVDLPTIASTNADICNMFISLCLCLFAESLHSTVLPNNRIFGMMLLVYLEEDDKCRLINKNNSVRSVVVFYTKEHIIQHMKLMPIPPEFIEDSCNLPSHFKYL
jgi:hypothetical protein